MGTLIVILLRQYRLIAPFNRLLISSICQLTLLMLFRATPYRPLTCLFGAVLCLLAGYVQGQMPAYPFPRTATYVQGQLPTTLTTADARGAYQLWKTGYLETCPNGSVRVKFDDPSQTVSEGIGYGMLLSAYYGDKLSFDGLWQYYQNHLNANGIMHWKINGCTGTNSGQNGATDAELDVALALVVADRQWGGYTAAATALIGKIKTHETQIVNGLHILKPGDAFGGVACTNASYFSPAYYRVYARVVPADSTFWLNMARDTYTSLTANANPTTGLVSDWQRADTGAPGDADCVGASFGFQGKRYFYDATRTPWRIGLDYLWGSSTGSPWLNKLTAFVQALPGGGIAAVKDGYLQDGTTTGQYHNAPFVGAFAVAAMASQQTTVNTFAADFKAINPQFEAYYGKSLRALYMLTLSGNFWDPSPPALSTTPPCTPDCLTISGARIK